MYSIDREDACGSTYRMTDVGGQRGEYLYDDVADELAGMSDTVDASPELARQNITHCAIWVRSQRSKH